MEKESYMQDIEKLLLEGNSIQFKPQGWSMYPTLVPGRDEVIVAPLDDDVKLKRSDVVLYRRMKENDEKDILVLHRIWKVSEGGIYLVGDNQKEIEGPLGLAQMLGIADFLIIKGKKISVKNPWYRFRSRVWLMMRPFRPLISKIVAKTKRFFGKKEK